MQQYHGAVQEAFRLCSAATPGGVGSVLIYGEYFGGYYPDLPAERGAKIVQKGVAYSPANHFYAFDVSINGDGYLDFDAARALLLAAGFPLVAAPLFRGSLDDLLSIDVESFRTTLPAILGHPPSERFQTAEGLVIRPAREVCSGQNRCILKKKAKAFWEATNQPGMALKAASTKLGMPGASTSDCMLLEAAKTYITENRIRSVLSKDRSLLGEDQLHKLAGLVTKDALLDFEKEHAEELSNHKTSMPGVRKALSGFTRFFVAEHITCIRAELI